MIENEAVIVDVDGTLCDVSRIRHYVTGNNAQRRLFDVFHRASALCPVIPGTLAWVRGHHAAGRTVIVVTARKQKFEYLTRRWLRKYEVPFQHLYFRDNADERRDDLVKNDILTRIREQGYTVVAAIDDNPNVITLWEKEGIPVTVVSGWDALPEE